MVNWSEWYGIPYRYIPWQYCLHGRLQVLRIDGPMICHLVWRMVYGGSIRVCRVDVYARGCGSRNIRTRGGAVRCARRVSMRYECIHERTVRFLLFRRRPVQNRQP